MTKRQIFVTRDGRRIDCDVHIDFEKILLELAEKAAKNKSKRSQECGGGVIVEVIEVS